MTDAREWTTTHALLVAAGLSALLGVLAGPWWTGPAAGCAFLAGRRPGSARVPALYLAAALAGGMAVALARPSWLTQGTRFVAVVLTAGMLCWCAGRFWRQYQDLNRAGWERAGHLARERELIAEQARLRERSRIAQDMHDALGHELSLLALSAGALKLADGLTAAHREAAADIRGRAESAVDRLGTVIGVLRETADETPTRPHGAGVRLLAEEASAAGLAVTARIDEVPDGDAHSPSPYTLRDTYRIVQEALTNVAKHAPEADVTVEVAHGEDGTRIAVENTPAPAAATDQNVRQRIGGCGLIGLEERVRLAGGTLSHGATPEGGFAVRALLPHTRAPQPSAASATVGAGPGPEERYARRRLGRTVLVAVTGCLSLGALLGGALAWWDTLVTGRAVLSAEDFGRLRVGQQRERIAGHLPAEQTRHRPAHTPPPPQRAGTTCEYYAMTANPFDDRSGDVYRICFRSDTLVSAEVLGA
ncbi:sensor histidine kinase [Streptomyces sp. NPDC007063]|uniref:sensor histidine kinase n=1 Tax=Streptomyces sp. NPDC007063 TaxID=3364772 RepID=UPI00367B56BE